jgi:two-component system, LytTR family, sensor kinase
VVTVAGRFLPRRGRESRYREQPRQKRMTSDQHSNQTARRPYLRTIAAYVVAWTVIGLVFTVAQWGQGGDPMLALKQSFADWYAWAVLSPFVFWLGGRLEGFTTRLPVLVACHVVCAVPFAVAHTWLNRLINAWFDPHQARTLGALFELSTASSLSLLWGVVVYLLLAGGLYAVTARDRQFDAALKIERLERSFTQARLEALRSKLDPHFIFNALNAVSAEVVRDPKLARGMIEDLSLLLRASLYGSRDQLVTLAQELELLEHYLKIQRARFRERLTVTMNIPQDAMSASIPSLLLQPIVENAITHGLAQKTGRWEITIEAALSETSLRMEITDNGVGLGTSVKAGDIGGIGLQVSRERLASLYLAGRSDLTISNRPEGGVRVVITIPYAKSDR